MILILSRGGRLLGDGDTGYHIRAGEYIIANIEVPKTDIFSFHSPEMDWTAHEWLSEVIMAVIHDFSGISGIVLFYTLILSLSFYMFFKVLNSLSNNIIIVWIVAFMGISCTGIHWLARPHVFSFLFLIIWYWILDSYEYKEKSSLIYYLPIIIVVWVNLHGGFILGLLLIGVYFIGNVLALKKGNEENKKFIKNKIKKLFMIGLLCILASMINPIGYKIIFFPFKFITQKYLANYISEFMPTNMQEQLAFQIFFFFCLTIILISKKKFDLTEGLLFLLLTYMSFKSVRYTTLFPLIVSPIIVKKLDFTIKETNFKTIKFIKEKGENIGRAQKSAKGFIWVFIVIIASIILIKKEMIVYNFNDEKHPVDAVNFLLEEEIKGNMFNNDEFGDYLIYAAYPKYKVFLDGRSDMYGEEMIEKYLEVIRIKSDWKKVLAEYGIDWVFYNSKSILSRYLYEQEDWHLIYADKVAHIYVKKNDKFKYIIERYKNIKPIYM